MLKDSAEQVLCIPLKPVDVWKRESFCLNTSVHVHAWKKGEWFCQCSWHYRDIQHTEILKVPEKNRGGSIRLNIVNSTHSPLRDTDSCVWGQVSRSVCHFSEMSVLLMLALSKYCNYCTSMIPLRRRALFSYSLNHNVLQIALYIKYKTVF